jgi:ABC-type transporter Mla subunit MlaD
VSAVIGIVVILAVVGLAAWAARPKKPKGRRGTGYGDRTNGDNVQSAIRYGPGAGPGV